MVDQESLLRLVSAYGPRERSKIARRLGVSRETIVRAYERMGDEGFGPRPDIRMDRLGLQRYAAMARGGTGGRARLASTLSLLGDYGYLEFYQRLDPSDRYLLVFAAPPQVWPELRSQLAVLGADGTLEWSGLYAMAWMRYHAIRALRGAEGSAEATTSGPLTYVPEGEPLISRRPPGYGELLMLAALQADPDAGLGGLLEIVRGWAGRYDDVKRYVADSGVDWNRELRAALRLVRSYPVHLSRGDPGIVRRRRHGWASVTLWWEGVGREEIRRCAMAATSVPYLRTDGAGLGKGFYFAVFAAPARLIPGYIEFMSQNAPEGMNVALASSFANYSLPFLSYSTEEGRWGWKKERLQSLLAALRTP